MSNIVYEKYKNDNKSRDKLINYTEQLDKFNNSTSDFILYAPIHSIQNFLARYELIKLIKNIPGAIIEMGVYSGNGLFSLIQSHKILESEYKYREFYGFDTFNGFISINLDKDIKDINWKEGDFSSKSYDNITNLINIHNSYYHTPVNLKLIKGDATKTVSEFLKDNKHIIISLLYLDMDIYEPTKIALKEFLPRMAKGSIIAFDELNWKSFPGETIAVLEELGTKYKFQNILNSHINYCVVE
jgi:hypothetical protein